MRRPVASSDRIEKLLAVADQVGPDFQDLLTVAIGTGRRLSAILNLRHGDVNLKPSGGWATVEMVTEICQRADEETTLRVVLGGGELREVGGR